MHLGDKIKEAGARARLKKWRGRRRHRAVSRAML